MNTENMYMWKIARGVKGGVSIDDLLKRLRHKRGNQERGKQRAVYGREEQQVTSGGDSRKNSTERAMCIMPSVWVKRKRLSMGFFLVTLLSLFGMENVLDLGEKAVPLLLEAVPP